MGGYQGIASERGAGSLSGYSCVGGHLFELLSSFMNKKEKQEGEGRGMPGGGNQEGGLRPW